MKITWMSARTTRLAAVAALSLAASNAVIAQVGLNENVPPCPFEGIDSPGYPARCVLTRNGDFETGAFAPWMAQAGPGNLDAPFAGSYEGSKVVTLNARGDRISQVVILPAGTSHPGGHLSTYFQRLSARASGPETARLRMTATLMVQGEEATRVPLINIESDIGNSGWQVMQERVPGKGIPYEPLIILVEIERIDNAVSTRLLIDDVRLDQERQPIR
ncbi:hypothetical protein EC912_11214 [Luteibacter rhizovicinus]|uniref:Uncharacterized protein n=1 Tax=Luteibacter rhizovicinus TaxID=242606 RepID=A0A4R3YIV5_9GAMM|nr:hypothetical protein [Luteibacter rhizovicinus]TCV91268.1 hypothetical protein EC912_11214 [Luteibacter rhizovicinus]